MSPPGLRDPARRHPKCGFVSSLQWQPSIPRTLGTLGPGFTASCLSNLARVLTLGHKSHQPGTLPNKTPTPEELQLSQGHISSARLSSKKIKIKTLCPASGAHCPLPSGQGSPCSSPGNPNPSPPPPHLPRKGQIKLPSAGASQEIKACRAGGWGALALLSLSKPSGSAQRVNRFCRINVPPCPDYQMAGAAPTSQQNSHSQAGKAGGGEMPARSPGKLSCLQAWRPWAHTLGR